MNYIDFAKMVENHAEHETIYQDSEGRSILVIRVLDAFGLVTRAIHAEREACAKLCDEMWVQWTNCEPEDEDKHNYDAEDCAKAIRARNDE